MAFLLVLCCGLTYYFHAHLRTAILFTHFFYLPVILACVWWRRRGLVVPVFLAALLIVSRYVFALPTPGPNDYVRAFMFIAIGFVVAVLSERIARQHDLLQKSEVRFQRMVAGIPGMVYQFLLYPDGSMAFPFISEGCKEFFDVSPEDVQQNAEAFLDLMSSEDRADFRRSVATSAESLSLLDFSGQAIVADEEKWFRALARPERQPNGDTLWNGVFVDISDLKRAEERTKHLNAVLLAIRNVNQLIAREKDRGRLLQGTCDNLIETRGYHNVWIALLDKSGRLVTTAERGLGTSFSPMMDRLRDGKLPHCASKALKQSGVVVTADPSSECADCPLSTEYAGRSGMALRLKHGSTLYGLMAVSIPAELAEDAEEQGLLGEVAGDIAFALHDIELDKQHERAEEALRESEKQYRAIFESATDALFIFDLDGNVVEANPAACATYGYSREEMIGLSGKDIIHPERYHLFEDFKEHVKTTGQFFAESVDVRKDGSAFDVEVRGTAFTFKGKPHLLALVRDITDRKQAEKELRLFSEAVETSIDGIAMGNLKGRITYVNEAFTRMFGYSREELIGKEIVDLYPENQVPKPEKAIKAALEGHWTGDMVAKRKDGGVFPIAVSASRVVDDKGKVVAHMASHRDMTEHKRLEEQLRQSQKMEAVGLLAGGVAHDFRNQLTVIKGFTEALRRRSLVAEEGRDKIAEILKAVERSTKLTGQLLAFSRKERLEPQVVDLSAVVADLSKALPHMIGEDIRLSVNPGAHPCRANVDPNLLQQAIMNLIVNARDAMPNGGGLVIETDVVDMDAKFVHRHHGAKPGQFAVISIEDTGVGMDEATRNLIFEPFFTTKKAGEGTGLGLSTVYGFAKQSGGFIECVSEPGKGARFSVYFPKVDRPATETETVAEVRDTSRGSETILVVEDEEPVRRMLVESLREGGYRVLEAANCAEALPLGEHFENQIDVLVTDIIMPGMDGVELAERIKAARPDIAVLLVSGYAEDDLSRRGFDSDRGNLLLIKPFSHEALLRRIRQVLTSSKGTLRPAGA